MKRKKDKQKEEETKGEEEETSIHACSEGKKHRVDLNDVVEAEKASTHPHDTEHPHVVNILALLPGELVQLIARYCTLLELATATLVCKVWRLQIMSFSHFGTKLNYCTVRTQGE